MKKYFTKYLPVEGEVKDGDYYFFENSTLAIQKNKMLEEKYPNESDNEPKIKVELFLCSRDTKVGDTQVGDTVFVNGHPHIKATKILEIENTNPEHSVHIPVYNCDNGDWYKPHEVFKPIGKVSPDAVWIKEGMEFDEKDVKFTVYKNLQVHEDSYEENVTESEWIEFTPNWPHSDKEIKFRCPSSPNHFH